MPTRSRKSAIHESSDSPTAGPDQLVVHAPAPDEPGMHPPAGPPPERRIESWPIAVLKPHDQQTALFHDLDGPEFDDLVESMGREGLREPIWATPDRILIDGHQRVRAAKGLGWTEIKVWVRDDLAGDQVAIDRAAHRRQPDPPAARSTRQRTPGQAAGRAGTRAEAGQSR